MARSIHVAIKEAVDAAIAAGRITEADRGTLKQFSAYKGDADSAGAQRYYFNAQLSESMEIPSEEVLAEVDLAGDASPLVLVLTRADAAIKHHQILAQDNREVQISETHPASFLAGDIAARHLDQSRIAADIRSQVQGKSIDCGTEWCAQLSVICDPTIAAGCTPRGN